MKIAMAALLTLVLTLGIAAEPDQAPKPNPAAPMYRQTGEQYRIYEFPGTGEPVPYRLDASEEAGCTDHVACRQQHQQQPSRRQ
jgi:hypothetical protein